MATGKNKLMRWARMWVNEADLSGDARSISSMDNTMTEIDMTGWSNAVRAYMADGFRGVGLRGFQAFMNDDTGGAFEVLTPLPSTVVHVTMALGGAAEPAVGDPAYMMGAAQMGDQASFDAGAGVLTLDFLPRSGDLDDVQPWGNVLLAKTALTVTTDGTAIDNGALSSAGYAAILHIFVSDAGTWAFELEHAVTPPTYSTLGTFTADGSAITSELKEGTGTVNQHVRLVSTKTSGTCTVACSFIRK